jgi:hypothetical protein
MVPADTCRANSATTGCTDDEYLALATADGPALDAVAALADSLRRDTVGDNVTYVVRGGAPAALADSIRNGDTQVAQIHGGAATFAQLSAIPDVRTARIVTPRVMQLTLRAQ